MSEFRNRKSSTSKPYKKNEGFTKNKPSTFGKEKGKRNFSKGTDQENTAPTTKKTGGKGKFSDKPSQFGKKSSDLVPRIKKTFKEFEGGEKKGRFTKKADNQTFKTRKPVKREWYDDEPEYEAKKEYKKDFKKDVKKDYKGSPTAGQNREFKREQKDAPKQFGNRQHSRDDRKNRFEKEDQPVRKTYRRRIGEKVSETSTSKKSEPTGEMRLNRYIAISGLCSRREADEMIRLGEVKVNGVVVTEMGTKVNTTDRVEVGGQSITPEKKVYILLNKPKDVVSTVSDPHAERTVLDLIKLAGNERVYPVGRLDKNTTGVLLLTNDGELTKKLTHPSHNKKKVYHVVLDKPATKANLQQIVDGIELEDGFINADAVSFVKEQDRTEIGIEIHSGRNRIVRRIFEYLGFQVVKLDRVYFAGLTKKNLPRGKWRFLSDKEIGMLKMGAYE
jgi:23S rRNA pseudouridine2605 synthase